MKGIHGGDIYRNCVKTDYSVNVNPLGMPKAVESALHEAVGNCSKYPDLSAEELKRTVSARLSVPKEYLLFGNGASELFMAIVHGIRPQKTVIPVPSFYGYGYAAEATDGEVIYYQTKEETNFCLTEDFFSVLTEGVDMLFLANPNNPTGTLLSQKYLRNLLCHCRKKGIAVVLDECFIEFCGEEYSMLQEIEEFPNLILVRAFTKIFSIPGVRLGYLVCRNRRILEKTGRQLPEWNVSGFAQAAGVACALQTTFLKKTVRYVKKEREFLKEGLRRLGMKVYPGEANFLFLYSEQLLYDELLKNGMLIRDCENFRGLAKGFYRIAVKSRKENERLLKAIGKIEQNGKK
ncbi:MAG: pyridoxal phosphate-dependent aminotransferase [Roseburia sp.]